MLGSTIGVYSYSCEVSARGQFFNILRQHFLNTMTAPSLCPFPLNIWDGILSTSNEREISGMAAQAKTSASTPESPCRTLLTASVLRWKMTETPSLSMTKSSPKKVRAILT